MGHIKKWLFPISLINKFSVMLINLKIAQRAFYLCFWKEINYIKVNLNSLVLPQLFFCCFSNNFLMCLKVFFCSFSCQLKWCKSPFFVLGIVSYLWISNYQKHLSVCNLLKRILHWTSSTFLGMHCLHIGILKKLQM